MQKKEKKQYQTINVCRSFVLLRGQQMQNRLTKPKPVGMGFYNYFTEMCSGSEAGSYLRLIDLCITQF